MSLRYRDALALVMLLCGIGCAAACGAANDFGEMSPSELSAALQGAQPPLVLDVRTPAEYASGHVPGARNVPIDELAARTGELAAYREQPVVVYCERGPRAHRAAGALASAGFTSVRELDGHMSAWREAGLPVE
jgi:rhodanese-related sulfurtransferase